MEVKISLEDFEENFTVEINNSNDQEYVWITLKDKNQGFTAKVSIEELKLALRKVCAK